MDKPNYIRVLKIETGNKPTEKEIKEGCRKMGFPREEIEITTQENPIKLGYITTFAKLITLNS